MKEVQEVKVFISEPEVIKQTVQLKRIADALNLILWVLLVFLILCAYSLRIPKTIILGGM